MKNEVYEELRKLSKKILEKREAPSLADQLREAQMLYETLLIANYLMEQEEPTEKAVREQAAPSGKREDRTITPAAGITEEPKTRQSEPENADKVSRKIEPQTPLTPPQSAEKKENIRPKTESGRPAFAADSAPTEAPQEKNPLPSTPPLSEKQAESVVQGSKSPSLNSRLRAPAIEIGLNDRIAFVKHLFDGKQEDFNRVLSQLNTMTNLEDAEDFIHNLVKPDYNWDDKEEYEARLMHHVYRKFGED